MTNPRVRRRTSEVVREAGVRPAGVARAARRMAEPKPATPVFQRDEEVEQERQRLDIADTTRKIREGVYSMALPEDGILVQAMRDSSYREYQAYRKGDKIHVSDLVRGCLRQRAILDTLGMRTPPRRITLQDKITFAQGDAVHDTIKELHCQTRPDNMYGNWMCLCKKTTAQELTYAEASALPPCQHCDQVPNRYDEITVLSEELGIVGHPDILHMYLVDVDDSMSQVHAFLPIEAKTMSKKMWEDLSRPLPEHTLQVLLYWRLMKDAGYNMVDSVTLEYYTKDWEFSGTPVKEFRLPAAELAYAPRIEALIDEAKSYRESQTTNSLPVRVQCKSPEDYKAKHCPVCTACFAFGDTASPWIGSVPD